MEPDSLIGQRSYLYALDPAGNIKWKYPFRKCRSCFYSNCNFVWAHLYSKYDGYLYAIRTDGKLEWEYFAGSITLEGINIDMEGSVYFYHSMMENFFRLTNMDLKDGN